MIFVIKIAARGDLLLSAPAFRYLRESRRGERIVLIVGESCRDVAEHLPYFDEIRTIDDAALFRGSRLAKLGAVRQMLQILRDHPASGKGAGVSEAIILHRDWRYALVAWLARIGTRRGFSAGVATRLLTHAHQAGAREHHEAQYLAVAGANPASASRAGQLWHFAPGERERALDKATALGLQRERRPMVALGFGGGRNVKMAVDLKLWPLERYEEVAARLDDLGFGIVWLGDGYDAGRLTRPVTGVNLAGQLTVPESAAVASECQLVIANDTMLLHMARALEVPALGIFGPTDPEHTGPHLPGSAHVWLGDGKVPCAPCHRDGYYPPCAFEHRCMQWMSVDEVLRFAVALLQPAARLDRSVGVR